MVTTMEMLGDWRWFICPIGHWNAGLPCQVCERPARTPSAPYPDKDGAEVEA